MVDPQLMDYVRQQVAAGVPREEISKTLIATGWKEGDVQEAFANVSTYTQPQVSPNPSATLTPTQADPSAGASADAPIVIERPVGMITAGKLMALFFGVVIVGGLGLVAAYYFHLLDSFLGITPVPVEEVLPEPIATSTPPTASTTPLAQLATTTATTTAPNTATTTATTTAIKAQPVTCTTEACFTPAFAACTKGSVYTANGGILGSVTYTVNGPATGGCSMTLVYTKNPNQSWVGKPLTCPVDPKLPFQTAVENVLTGVASGKVTTCTGTLVPLLKGTTK